MSTSTTPAPVKPPLSTRVIWGLQFGLSGLLTVIGLWVSWFDPSSRLGSPFIAVAVALLAAGTAHRTWFLLQGLTEALMAMTEGLDRATRGPVRAPESAAERLAAPAEGSGHPERSTGRSGLEEPR